ncbi:hypothetical protein BZA77DRAFT_295329 [Pyronema omphalodes]|nr:hypothetical protein BZA77DRAFT_295329 [Pyronema omphalodes]
MTTSPTISTHRSLHITTVLITLLCLLHPIQSRPTDDTTFNPAFINYDNPNPNPPLFESYDISIDAAHSKSTENGNIMNQISFEYDINLTPLEEAAEVIASEVIPSVDESDERWKSIDTPDVSEGIDIPISSFPDVDIPAIQITKINNKNQEQENHTPVPDPVTVSIPIPIPAPMLLTPNKIPNILHPSKFSFSKLSDTEKYGYVTLIYISAGLLVSVICWVCDVLRWVFMGGRVGKKKERGLDLEKAGGFGDGGIWRGMEKGWERERGWGKDL